MASPKDAFGYSGTTSGGTPIDSCAILTATPNELLQPLHHRMAVILPASTYSLWLDAAIQEVERLQPLLRPYPAEEMTA